MSKNILIIAPSGSGKTTSIRNLDPKSTFIINALKKDLPWKNSAKQYTYFEREKNPKGNMLATTNNDTIIKLLQHISDNRPEIKDIIIDDNTFVTAMELQRRRTEGWDKFSIVTQNILDLVNKSKTLRDDIIVYFLHHTKQTGDGVIDDKQFSAMSYGKMLDERLGSLEAQFTIVLRAAKIKEGTDLKYVFYTKDGESTVKTPMDMFETDTIPNDLTIVRKAVDCYFNGDEDC